MAISLVGGTGFQHGIEAAETGVNIESFAVRYFPEINKRLAGITGETFLRAQSSKFSREVTYSGEVSGSTGLMASTVATALTFANDDDTFGDGSGTVLLDEVSETQSRDGWRKIDGRASSDPLCVAA